ncbi:MAG: hypothetical protein AMXMBFR13_26030 [Phycisphaerae bacterium]
MSRRRRIGLIAYDYPPFVGGMATYALALSDYLAVRGYEVHVFANTKATADRNVHPVLTTDLARDLPILARERMDLWHSVNFGYAPLAVLRRPFVLTVHGTDFLTPWVQFKMERLPFLWRGAGLVASRPVRRALHAGVLRCVNQVLTCSRFSARLFRREYPSVGHIQVVPNGVDVPAADSTAGTRSVRHPRRLLTVCNLGTANLRKNVDGCIRAVAQVGEQLDLEYCVVGEGPLRPKLEALTCELGVADRVRFMGRVSDEALRELYASSSLFVLVPRPMPGDVEGFGIVYLEAAAAGTPSLAGRWGGAPEAVAENESGFLSRDASPEAIAEALRDFFTGAVQFDERAVKAHAERHRWDRVLAPVGEVYARLLGESSPIEQRAPGAVHAERRCRLNRSAENRKQRAAGFSPRGRSNGENGALPAVSTCSSPRRARTAERWSQWVQRDASVSLPARNARVLLLSYSFPPTGGSAVQRPAKLAKYLHELGWSVEVMTAAHERFPWSDALLLDDVPAACRVHRVAGWEPACVAGRVGRTAERLLRGIGRSDRSETDARWLEDRVYWRLVRGATLAGLGAGEALWVSTAAEAALRRHRREPFDAVISTGPPHFVHRVALRMVSAAGLPWIADLRDPLVSDFDRTPAAQREQQHMRRLERIILKRATAVVTTCPSFAADLRARYPWRFDAIRAITNGFDRADLRTHLNLDSPSHPREPVCTFVAAGALYGRRELDRLVDPLRTVLDRHLEWHGRVRLVIAGTLDAQQRRRWQRESPEWLHLAGYLDHGAALRLLQKAACSVVVVPDCRHGRLSVPGKTFELLALPVHVLALAPEHGDTARIVLSAGASTVAPLEDVSRVAVAMEQIIGDWFAGRLTCRREWSEMDRYDRRTVAAKFAECIAKACGWKHEVRRERCAKVKSVKGRGVNVRKCEGEKEGLAVNTLVLATQ